MDETGRITPAVICAGGMAGAGGIIAALVGGGMGWLVLAGAMLAAAGLGLVAATPGCIHLVDVPDPGVPVVEVPAVAEPAPAEAG